MLSVFDLHVHTAKGSSDSGLLPGELLDEVKRLDLTGVCLTEHGGWPDRQEFDRFARDSGLVIVRALEVDTDMGHILVLGLDGYQPGFSSIRELRRVVNKAGGFMIAAHPFRNLFNPPPYNRNLLYRDLQLYPAGAREAVSHPIFELVDEVEVVNGANTDQENLFALEVTRRLGRSGTGGSDAHSNHGIGKGVTVFEGEVRSAADLLEALKSGSFSAVEGFHLGRPWYFGKSRGDLPPVASPVDPVGM
ncbi:MAG: PHP domain-containing protein [Chloroflexi bacterium]|nr:PHP domain-containing protein [Chloroflexota bacterium]